MESKDLFTTYLQYINERLVLAVASNAAEGAECSKLKLRPIRLKQGLAFQATRTVGPKELHDNYDAEGAARLLADLTGTAFRQVEIKNEEGSVLVMVSKKGKLTLKQKRTPKAAKLEGGQEGAGQASGLQAGQDKAGQASGLQAGLKRIGQGPACGIEIGSNNRKKNYILEDGRPVDFLVELGVMSREGRVHAAKYDKFRQINRYLEFVEDILPSLPRDRELSIIDFGCGKSYLTFALYYYLHELKGYDIRVTGLDLKKDVIATCSALAQKLGYDKLEFLHGDIADYTGTDSVDMVVTLHACDTATDYALFKAISWGARVIFCVPCCQHELNKQIKNSQLGEVLKYGLLKERMSALLTDGLRACMLEDQGYKTQVLEFIDMEHTPKNILIRAVKQAPQIRVGAKKGSSLPYKELMKELNAELTLDKLLHGEKE